MTGYVMHEYDDGELRDTYVVVGTAMTRLLVISRREIERLAQVSKKRPPITHGPVKKGKNGKIKRW